MSETFVFTSESVAEGHPDKLCDTISDALVGLSLRQDPLARVAVECAVSTGIVFVAVRHALEGAVDVPRVVREVIRDVGYDTPDFNPRDCTIMTSMAEMDPARRPPAPEDEMDAGALGRFTASTPITVFGYACDHTDSLLPLPIHLAHALARRLGDVRRSGRLPWLSPDGSAQVSVEFRDRRPVRIHGVSLLAAHQDGGPPDLESLREALRTHVVDPVLETAEPGPDERTRVDLNPEGLVGGGGPARHAGLTGRKTQVDTYGEYSRNSSSALSGKDPSRIDRVGAYAARHAAKCLVAAGLAREAEVMLSYSPGLADPVSVRAQSFGTGRVEDEALTERLRSAFDFRPAAIAARFRLRKLPRRDAGGYYRRLATYGQMGRTDLDAPWEDTALGPDLT